MADTFRNQLNGATGTTTTLANINALGSDFTSLSLTQGGAFVVDPAGGANVLTGTSSPATFGRLDATLAAGSLDPKVSASFRYRIAELPTTAMQIFNSTVDKDGAGTARSGPAINVKASTGQLQLAIPSDSSTVFKDSGLFLTAAVWFRIGLTVDIDAGTISLELRDAADAVLGTYTQAGQNLGVAGVARFKGMFFGKADNTAVLTRWHMSNIAYNTGTNSLLGVPSMAVTVAAALSGAGALTAAGSATVTTAVGLSGTGTLTATGVATYQATAALTGAGTLTATAAALATATAGLSGAGSLAATTSTVASLTGAGQITATGRPSVTALAPLAGAGTLTATGFPTVTAVATLTGSGALTTTTTVTTAAAAFLTGAGALTADGVPLLKALAALIGAGTLTAHSARPRDIDLQLGNPRGASFVVGHPGGHPATIGAPAGAALTFDIPRSEP